METPDITLVADGLSFPEGPICTPDGSIYLVEIATATLTKITPGGRKHIVAELGGGPNGAAVGPDGKIYICNNGGFAWARTDGILRPVGVPDDYQSGWIERVDPATGEAERLFDSVEGVDLTGPNDIVFDASGAFWFTDHGKKHARHMDLGAVYRATENSVKEVAFPLLGPNGIGLSPGEDELYVAETPTGRIWAYPVTHEGTLEKGDWTSPTGGRLVCGLPGLQRYDSLAIEQDGTISVASLRSGGIVSVKPDGTLVRRIDLPDPYTTNISFGGTNMMTAYVTLSGTGQLISMKWPAPGLKPNFYEML